MKLVLWVGRSVFVVILLGVLAGVFSATVMAADVYITAEFKPSVQEPHKTGLSNTTPWSGVCNSGHLATCIRNNWWSIDTGIRGVKLGDGRSGYGRGSVYIRMPAARFVTLTSEDGATTYTFKLRIIGTAIRYNGPSNGRPNPASVGALRNCNKGLSNDSAGNRSTMTMFIRRDSSEGSQYCARDWLAVNPYDLREFDVVYAMDAVNPLSMRSAVYTGSASYTVGGAGNDFDLGDDITVTDSNLTLHFTVTVEHMLAIEFPPGGNHIVLQPPGGWGEWIHRGKAPQLLRREMPFRLWSSGPFTMHVQCDYYVAARCGIRNARDGHDVPVDVAVTLPGISHSPAGNPVLKQLLGTDKNTAPHFLAPTYVANQRSVLHFEVGQNDVADMLTHAGALYKGNVTVMFDSGL